MKKIHWLFGLLLSICYSCSELDDFSVESTSESLSTPTLGMLEMKNMTY